MEDGCKQIYGSDDNRYVHLHSTKPLKTMLTQTNPRTNLNTRYSLNQGHIATKIPSVNCIINEAINVFFLPNLQKEKLQKHKFKIMYSEKRYLLIRRYQYTSGVDTVRMQKVSILLPPSLTKFQK